MAQSGVKRVAILTGGGDCPGLNAVIRAVAKTLMFGHGVEVLGVRDAFLGLIENRIHPLTADDCSGILTVGGTILGTSNKTNPARFPTSRDEDGSPVFSDLTDLCVQHLEEHKVDALVVIGGDGSMSIASHFVERGVNCIGVPKTIDNDIVGTDLSFGFLTAVSIATDALDRIHTTAASHSRVMLVEVMGRNAGWIALHAGIASGSDVILIPERPFDIDAVIEKVEERESLGRKYTVVCVAEGARPAGGEQVVSKIDPESPDPVRLGGIGDQVAKQIEARTDRESRCAVLGHVQRGGSPVSADRVLATRFGCHAAGLIASGARNRLVVFREGEVGDADILKAADRQRTIPEGHPLVGVAEGLGTSFGDRPNRTSPGG